MTIATRLGIALITAAALGTAAGCGSGQHAAESSSGGTPPTQSKPALYWDGTVRTWDNSDWT